MKKFLVLAVALMPLALNSSPAVAELELNSVTLTAGFGSGIGAGARAELGEIADNLSIVGAVDYWRWDTDLGDYYGVYDLTYQRFAVQPTVLYRFPMDNSKFSPFAEGGLSIGYLSFSDEFGSASGVTTGIYLAGGVDYPISSSMSLGGTLALDHGDFSIGPRLTFRMGD